MSHQVHGGYGEGPMTYNTTGNETFGNGTLQLPPVINAPTGSATRHMFRLVCELGFSFPLAIAGIIGNILALVVLSRYKNRRTTTVLLQALAVADTLVLANTICLRSSRYLHRPFERTEMYHLLFRWLYPSTYFFRLADTWLTVLLTVDRFIAVCIPLKASRLCTLTRTYILMLLVVIASFLFSLPRYFEYKMVMFTHPDTNLTRQYFMPTSLVEIHGYNIGYRIAVYFLVMYLVPMTLLVVLNTALVVALQRAQRQRCSLQLTTQLSANSANNRSVTIIVVTVVIVCVACNISSMVGHILWSIPQAYKELALTLDEYRRYVSNVSNVLVTLNSAINFIIYCLCSRNFRSVLVQTLHCEPACDTGQASDKHAEQAVLLKRNSSSVTHSTILRNSTRKDAGNEIALSRYVSRSVEPSNGLPRKECQSFSEM